MDTDGSGDSGFEDRGGSHLDCPSLGIFAPLPTENVLGMTISSEPLCKSWNGVNSFFNGGWDPLVLLAQNVEIKAPPMASHDQIDSSSYTTGILENQGISSTSHLVHYPSNPCLVGLMPNIRRFGSGSISEMDSSSFLPKCHQVVDSICTPDYPLEGIATEKTLTSRNGTDNCARFREERQNSDEGMMKPSSNGKKRKKVSDDRPQINVETVQHKDEYPEEQDEGKQKTELNPVANMCGKHVGIEVKDCSHNGEAPKEDYVHMRAKRGQATNSHSLAERVRREKISERMKFLQDLVPGCNKITGKAVMLDEIINYVQSLQRQVEFLSMKLATVYPEMNVEIERILSKDIHHSQGGTAAILGFDPVMSSSYPIPQVTLQGALPVTQGSNLQSPVLPQMPSVWNDELQSISQMDFISNPALDNLEPNG